MIIADLHIHSRFAAACSKQISIENLEKYARIKGVQLLGTGDFQHPLWFKELSGLEEDENGILWTKNKFPFLWQTELSLIYTQGGRGRRIHHLVYAPNKEVVEQIIESLGKKGRLDYDGRPIFGFSSIELVDMMKSISEDIEIVPAHAWTSWFAIFGSKSGFDSIKECFEERSNHIHAIETGLSSDPGMNDRLSQLDGINFVSFSDMHSFWPWRIGRECTIFDTNFSYNEIMNAVRTGKGLQSTIEVVPDYGKYHLDGHRKCGVVFSPEESKKHNNICPKCNQGLTIGVLNRVEELADRPEEYKEENGKPYVSLIPLSELISSVCGYGIATQKTWSIYNNLISKFDNEFNILLNVDEHELKQVVDPLLVNVIMKNRMNNLKIDAGYDGEYGKIVMKEEEKIERKGQKSLTEF